MGNVPFTDIDAKYGLPAGLLASVWKQESGCGQFMVSHAGARSHFQFMPATRDEMIQKIGLDPWSANPRIGAECAGYYIDKQRKSCGGDLLKALSSYNAGLGNVKDAIASHGANWLASLKPETQKYGKEILDRIHFTDRVDFTNRYERGEITDPTTLATEDKERRGILTGLFCMPEDLVKQFSSKDILGGGFLAFVLNLLSGLLQQIDIGTKLENKPLMVAQADYGSKEVPRTPTSSKVAAVVTPKVPARA